MNLACILVIELLLAMCKAMGKILASQHKLF